MSNLSEEEIREAISCIRVLYSLMYNFEDGLKDKMQGRIDYLEKFINSLLNRYNNLKEIEKEHQKLNGELREELNREKEKNKILELTKIPYLEGEIMAYKENDAVQRKMLNDAFDRGWIHKDKVRERIRELKIIRDENADEIKRNMRFYSIYDSYNLQINELHDLLLEEWLDE